MSPSCYLTRWFYCESEITNVHLSICKGCINCYLVTSHVRIYQAIKRENSCCRVESHKRGQWCHNAIGVRVKYKSSVRTWCCDRIWINCQGLRCGPSRIVNHCSCGQSVHYGSFRCIITSTKSWYKSIDQSWHEGCHCSLYTDIRRTGIALRPPATILTCWNCNIFINLSRKQSDYIVCCQSWIGDCWIARAWKVISHYVSEVLILGERIYCLGNRLSRSYIVEQGCTCEVSRHHNVLSRSEQSKLVVF